MGERLTRIGWAGRHWALVFDRAGGVGPLRPAQRSPAQTFTDYAQQMLVCLRRWLPERDLVVGRWRLRQARVPAALPEYVKADCRRHQTAQGRVPVPARATAAARPDRAAPGGRRATAQSHGGAGRSRYTMDSLPRHRFRRQYRVELASGVALWYHGGPPRLPIRWVHQIPGGAPRALALAPTPRRNPCGYCSGSCGRSRSGSPDPAPVVGTSHRPNHPRALWPVQRGDAGGGYPDRTAWRHGARTVAWYDRPFLTDAIALVRRHLWVQGNCYAVRARHESIKVPRLLVPHARQLAYAA